MTTNDANQTSPASQISLLAYLAYKFGGQTETIATEALDYILSRSEAARNALRERMAPRLWHWRAEWIPALRGNDGHGGAARPMGTRLPPTRE